jgi:CRISPR/Cas system CMR-associated protein Cmr5 small subunit
MSTRQQDRAVRSHDLVKAASEATATWDKYRTFCMKGPTLLQQSGLMQTSVFCSSRSDEGARTWLEHVTAVMNPGIARDKLPNLAERARKAPLAEYLALSRDALDAATWLRRYAMAFDKGDAGTPTESDR